MGILREFSYPSSDGRHTIRAKEWLPSGPVRGVVQIVHGVADYVGRYAHVARFLNRAGVLVCGEDHLGHGDTADNGKYGCFAPKQGWDYVTRDVYRLRQLQGEKYPGVPYVMLGHSMGSFLVRTCLIRWPGALDGAVLSGTGQEPPFLVAGGKEVAELLCLLRGPDHVSGLSYNLTMEAYNNSVQSNRTPYDWISRDEAVVNAHVLDPRCTFHPTISMLRDMIGGMQFIADQGNLARMDKETPVYLFSGDRDPVGSMGKGVERVAGMFRAAGCTNVEVKLYPGGRHEMLHEINRQEVMEDLLAWLEGIL